MEGSLVAYKVFSNGSVLNASDINDNLMRQSVIVFSNAAARSAAITVPLEGMLTWLEDINDYQYWNGSAWTQLVAPTGLTLIKTQAIGTGVSSVTVNDAFNTNFDSYKVVITGGTGSAAGYLSLRLGAVSTQYYQARSGFTYSGTTPQNGSESNVTQFLAVGRFDGDMISVNMDIINPFLAKRTTVCGTDISASIGGWHTGIQLSTTSFTSFTLNASTGSITGGTVFVYGYRKA